MPFACSQTAQKRHSRPAPKVCFRSHNPQWVRAASRVPQGCVPGAVLQFAARPCTFRPSLLCSSTRLQVNIIDRPTTSTTEGATARDKLTSRTVIADGSLALSGIPLPPVVQSHAMRPDKSAGGEAPVARPATELDGWLQLRNRAPPSTRRPRSGQTQAAESDSVPSLDNAAPTSLRLKQGCPAGVPAARLQLRFERIERHDVMALIK